MLTQILFLIAGFFFLIKGADYLVRGAASFAKARGVSTLVIGLTIVAFGTSAPELIVNLFSAWQGSTEIAVGNIFGSNIANTFLVLGLMAVLTPIKVSRGTVWKEIPLSLLAIFAVLALGSDILIDGGTNNLLTRIDGLILLMFFGIFLYYTYGVSKMKSDDGLEVEKIKNWQAILMIIVGMIGLFVGGKYIVDAAVYLAQAAGIGQHLIGVTIVAFGTSLPELVTSIVAARKKHVDLAVGNIVGSNIFNLLFILGTTALISPLAISSLAMRDAVVVMVSSLLLFMAMFVGRSRSVDRWQGFTFVIMYVSYIVWSVVESI